MVIYKPDNTTLLTIYVDDDSDRQAELMGDDCLTLRFSLAEYVDIPLMSYTVFQSVKYYLFHNPQITRQHSRKCEYDMQMYTSAYLLKITMMRDDSGSSLIGIGKMKFPLTATPREHLEKLADCLNLYNPNRNPAHPEYLYNGKFVVDYSQCLGMVEAPEGQTGAHTNYDGSEWDDYGDMKLVSYENITCHDAIASVADIFNTEFAIIDDTYVDEQENEYELHFITLCDIAYDNGLTLSYGKTGGLKSGVKRLNKSDVPPLDRLFVQGGEQNIPENYGRTRRSDGTYEGIINRVLLLPNDIGIGSYNGIVRYNGEHLYFESKVQSNLYAEDVYYKTGLVPVQQGSFIVGKGYFFDCELRYVEYTVTAQGGDVTYIKYYDDLGHEQTLWISTSHSDKPNIAERLGVDSTYNRYGISSDRSNLIRLKDTGGNTDANKWRSTNVEGWFDGSDVYPMRVGAVSAIATVKEQYIECYDIYDAGLDFSYTDYYLDEEKMTIMFQDGMLAGREFEVQTYNGGENDKKPICELDNNMYRIPLCPSEQDGIIMPGSVFLPAIGDHYVAFHCKLPINYIKNAEFRLLWVSVDYLYHNEIATYTIDGDVDRIWIKDNNTLPVLNVGAMINVTDEDFLDENGLIMRVTGVRQNVNDIYDVRLTLTNKKEPVFDWVKRLSGTVKSVYVRPQFLRPQPVMFPRSAKFEKVWKSTEDAENQPSTPGITYTARVFGASLAIETPSS